jgi:hypothetical protein
VYGRRAKRYTSRILAATASTAAPGGSARASADRCARCKKPFLGPEDRRAQLRAPDLCRACHLDPRARSLPLETDIGKGWLGRCAKTMVQLIVSPGASFRVVEEPVSHARVLAFLATIRLPLWLVALGWAGFEWLTLQGPPGPLRRPSYVGLLMRDAQFADVLRLWLLLLVPIGLPMLYFFGGILGHMGMALTGGARRSIGATMRAVGLALAPSLLLVGIADLLAVGLDVSPEIWVGVVALAALCAVVFCAVALARTHSTSLVRGLLVAVLPVAFFTAVTFGRGLLEHPRLPFMPLPPLDDSYAPYPIE